MMPSDPLTPDALRALLSHLLAGAAGGTDKHWSARLGDLKRVNLSFHPASNWELTPRGSAKERKAITNAIEIVRAEHPYVVW